MSGDAPNDPRVSVLFEAMAIAMKAKLGDVDKLDVDDLVTKAQQLLPPETPEHRAITGFATGIQVANGDPATIIDLGVSLHDAIERVMRPDPIDAERADIHG